MIHGPCSRLIGCTIHTPTRARFGERVYKMDCKVTNYFANIQRFRDFLLQEFFVRASPDLIAADNCGVQESGRYGDRR